MSIITTAQAVPSRLFAIYAVLFDAEHGEPKDRLEAWATPPSLAARGTDEEQLVGAQIGVVVVVERDPAERAIVLAFGIERRKRVRADATRELGARVGRQGVEDFIATNGDRAYERTHRVADASRPRRTTQAR